MGSCAEQVQGNLTAGACGRREREKRFSVAGMLTLKQRLTFIQVGVEEAWRTRRVKGKKLKHPVSESRKVEQMSQTQKYRVPILSCCQGACTVGNPVVQTWIQRTLWRGVGTRTPPPPPSFNRHMGQPGKVTSRRRCGGGITDRLCWNL